MSIKRRITSLEEHRVNGESRPVFVWLYPDHWPMPDHDRAFRSREEIDEWAETLPPGHNVTVIHCTGKPPPEPDY